MNKRSHGALILFFFVSMLAVGQISQPYRFEKEQKFSDEYFTIIPMQEMGLALFRQTNDYSKGDRLWELIVLDSTLKEVGSKNIPLATRVDFIGYDFQPGEVSVLFRDGQTQRADLKLIVSHLPDMRYQTFDIKPEIDLRLSHFVQVGGSFAFGGYVSNEPAIVLYDTIGQTMTIVPGFFQKDMELVDLRANSDHLTFNAVLIDRGNRDDRKLIFRTFDLKGSLVLEDIIDVAEEKMLMNGIVTTLEREDIVIMGTWGGRNSKQALGVYAVPVKPFEKQSIQYFDFGKFDHVFDYMKPKRAKRIREKIQEDVKAGRNPSYSNYVMPFRILEHKHGYILLADVYNPSSTYSQNSFSNYSGSGYGGYPYYDPYFGSYYNPRRVYNGPPFGYGNNMYQDSDNIKTYETFLTSIDGQGNFRWDYSFPLDDVKLSSVEQTADFLLTDGSVYFVYKKENTLKIKVISIENEEDPRESEESIRLKSDLDEVRSENERVGNVRYWFGNSFYVWGIQNIRNKTEVDKTRKVFYINRLVAH